MNEPGRSRDVPEVAPEIELASALADGEATTAEQRRAADPAVAAALAAHREVARLVAVPVVPPASVDRDAALAAALAAFDRGETDASPPVPADTLAARRTNRWRPEWIAAVAAALLVVAGLAVFGGLSGDDDDSTETADAPAATALEADAGAGGAGASEESIEAPTDGVAESGADLDFLAIPYLGDVADIASLQVVAGRALAAQRSAVGDAAATTIAAAPTGAGTAGPAAVPCSAEVAEEVAAILGTATVNGHLATVLIEVGPDGSDMLVVLAEPDCERQVVPF